jgi:hypothetical protein
VVHDREASSDRDAVETISGVQAGMGVPPEVPKT